MRILTGSIDRARHTGTAINVDTLTVSPQFKARRTPACSEVCCRFNVWPASNYSAPHANRAAVCFVALICSLTRHVHARVHFLAIAVHIGRVHKLVALWTRACVAVQRGSVIFAHIIGAARIWRGRAPISVHARFNAGT